MSKEKSCCFTGHRIVGNDLTPGIIERGIRHLALLKGVDTFIVGGALGFDTLCAQAVLRVKKEMPHIKLHIYAPCNNQAQRWRQKDIDTYYEILEQADYVDMPSVPYYDGCMKERNYKMVDNSSYCIAYYKKDGTGTAQTIAYASKSGLAVYNLVGKA